MQGAVEKQGARIGVGTGLPARGGWQADYESAEKIGKRDGGSWRAARIDRSLSDRRESSGQRRDAPAQPFIQCFPRGR